MKSSQPAVILCIDDDPTALMIRSVILKQAGYAVLTAETGEEALTKLRGANVNLVLSDHHLVGTTGTELAATIKQIRPDVLCVLLTGSPHLAENADHLDLVLTKGTDPKEILDAIAKLLARNTN